MMICGMLQMPKLFAEIWAILLMVNQIIYHSYIIVSKTVLLSFFARSSVFLVLLLSKLYDSGTGPLQYQS